MNPPFKIAVLGADHRREGFACGVPALDRYFLQQVGQDMRRRIATCFVVLDDNQTIVGFYTLASAGVALEELPPAAARKLPRYPSVPAVRLGRLAVSLSQQGRGLGAAMLADAFARAHKAEIAAYALIADAKDEAAAAFYRHHGFIPFDHLPLSLFLPFSTALPLMAES